MTFFRTLRRSVTWISLGIAGGAMVVTARHLLETPQPLDSALPGAGHIDRKHGGDIYYNVAGPADAEPIVLLHDFYPGASNFEFRRVFPALAARNTVYAPDWLGFGMSEHPAVAYTGEFYASVLTGFLRDVVERPATVIAHGLAANVAVRAASDNPDVFSRLILVAPDVMAGAVREPTVAQALVRATRRVSLGIVPYALLSTRPALRWLASSRSLRAGEGVPSDEDIDRLYASAHQFGGQHALLAALTGDLDLAMPNAFALLEPPVLIISGDRDRRHPRVDMEDVAVLNPHADLDVIPHASDVVFEDQPEAFVAAVERWLETPATRHTLDESALLYPRSTGGPTETPQKQATFLPTASTSMSAGATKTNGSAGLVAESRGGIVMDGSERPSEMLTDEAATQPDLTAVRAQAEANHDEDAPLTGTPGSVTPGVSDSGQEGPATADVAGVSTLEEPTITLDTPGPAPAAGATTEPADLIPEAGESEPRDISGRETSAGTLADGDLAPNIADVGADVSDPETSAAPASPQPPHLTPETADRSDAELAGPGDVAGLAEIVQTPVDESHPEVPASKEARPAEPAEPKRPAPARREQPTQASQTSRRAASGPAPRAQPHGNAGRTGHGGSGRKRSSRKSGK